LPGFLLLLVLPWVSGKRVQGRIAAAVAFVYVMLSLVNLHYFGFYKTPIDSLVFGLVEDDTVAVLQTIWRDFPVVWTLLLAVLLTVLSVVLAPRVGAPPPARHRAAAPAMLPSSWCWHRGIFCTGFWRARARCAKMALQRQHLTVTTSQFLNDMVPNGVIALKYAWDSRGQSQNLQNPLTGLKAMGFDSPLAAAEVLGLPHGRRGRSQGRPHRPRTPATRYTQEEPAVLPDGILERRAHALPEPAVRRAGAHGAHAGGPDQGLPFPQLSTPPSPARTRRWKPFCFPPPSRP
jgi:hypothetical protein